VKQTNKQTTRTIKQVAEMDRQVSKDRDRGVEDESILVDGSTDEYEYCAK
jgi:hypothetical protein